MQRYLLPQLPRVPGLEMTSRYARAGRLPRRRRLVRRLPLGEGDTALVIGDVSGHDLDAAAGMAQLRNVLRSYAWSSRDEPPGRVVERVDRAVLRITDVSMATLVLAVLGTDEDGRWTLRWTNSRPSAAAAGHPRGRRRLPHGGRRDAAGYQYRPAACRRIDGPAPGRHSRPLHGRADRGPQPHHRRWTGAAAPARRRARPPPGGEFTDELLHRARPVDNDDDVALLAVRVGARPVHVGPRPAGG